MRLIYFAKNILLLVLPLGLLSCASLTPTQEVIENYAIYDIKPMHNTTSNQIIHAIKIGLQKNMSSVRLQNLIPPAHLPKEPGRFTVEDPFKGSSFSSLASLSGTTFKVVNCDHAILIARSEDTTFNKYGENTNFFLCLLPYQGGYHLDIYHAYSKYSGALSTETISATLITPFLGDSRKFIPRTIQSIISEINKLGYKTKLIASSNNGEI